MSGSQPFLSKSKYLSGLQCSKLLWMSYHAKEQFPPVDPRTQAIFDQGHEVGQLAKKLFPGGIEIGGVREYEAILADTQKALKERKPLYEPGFQHKNTYARADILVPRPGNAWDIVEVKSSTKVSNVNILDAAFQKYCYEGAGLKIAKTYLMHINNQYVRKGEVDPKELFAMEDITKEVHASVGDIEKRVEAMLAVIAQKKNPSVKIGPHCDDPYTCPLKSVCWDFLPEHNVFTLNRIRKDKAFGFLGQGILDIRDLAEGQSLSASQAIQRQARLSGRAHVDKAQVREFLDQLQMPLYFLDFETVTGAIPPYDASRPYQQVPFQFSLHILNKWGEEPLHHGHLAEGRSDPRPEFLKELKGLLGKKGTILAYNLSFELGRLRECAEVYPEYSAWVQMIEPRCLDLIVPFRNFDYYNPGQMGKTSIKRVYPALTGGSYEGMGISDGGAASSEYARVTFTDVSPEERRRVRDDLEAYCKLDTQAMIEILNELRKAV
jgi:hypothetical protein